MTHNLTNIQTLLNFDPLQAAETITGQPTDNQDTIALGCALAAMHADRKHEVLQEIGDTTFRSSVKHYKNVITKAGFIQVLTIPVGYEGRSDMFFVYAHQELGILLSFDTYGNNTVINGSHMYYCIEFKGGSETPLTYNSVSSGSMLRDSVLPIWVGHHDGREGLISNIRNIQRHWTFLPKWPTSHNQFLWLLHYADTKQPGYSRNAINAHRISMLPGWVQEMIAG